MSFLIFVYTRSQSYLYNGSHLYLQNALYTQWTRVSNVLYLHSGSILLKISLLSSYYARNLVYKSLLECCQQRLFPLHGHDHRYISFWHTLERFELWCWTLVPILIYINSSSNSQLQQLTNLEWRTICLWILKNHFLLNSELYKARFPNNWDHFKIFQREGRILFVTEENDATAKHKYSKYVYY